VSLLGVEVFAIDTHSDSPAPELDREGDATSMPMGFVARMDVPYEADAPDRDL
jgi:hypothetical protein